MDELDIWDNFLVEALPAPGPRDKPLEELEKEITCAVCQGVYQQAKLLSCNHYYCSKCIENMAAASRDTPLHCPECRKQTILPPSGVSGLEPAFFVERMKNVYGNMAKAEGKVEAFCEQCSASGAAVAFCRQCAEFICGDCVAIHKKLKSFTGHVVTSLEDLKKGGAKSIPLKESPVVACADHSEPKKLFCFDCDCLICRDCTIIDHRHHKFDFLNKCAPESRTTLRNSLAPLQNVQATLADAEKTLLSEEDKVDQHKEEISRSIQRSFDQLRTLLDRRKSELVRKAASLAQEKKDVLAAQRGVIQVAQKEVQLLVELVEKNVEGTSDQDFMSVQKQLQTKITEEEKRHQELVLEPVITLDITCNLPSNDDIPNDLGAVFVSPPVVQNVGRWK